MTVLTRGGNSLAGFILVALAHVLVFYLLLENHSRIEQPAASRYSQLLFIIPPRKPALAEKSPALPVPAANKPVPPRRPAANIQPKSVEMTGEPPAAEKPAPADNADPFDQPARLDIGNLVRQAGKADRETRSAREMQGYGPSRQSVEAIMSRAFTEAKLAVPPKWYEAARIELFSAPNDPKKIYQVKTAFGTYCLFYPSMYEEGGGGASARQPKVGTCPTRFGPGSK